MGNKSNLNIYRVCLKVFLYFCCLRKFNLNIKTVIHLNNSSYKFLQYELYEIFSELYEVLLMYRVFTVTSTGLEPTAT